jgi:RHS repeat-associated protein
MSVHLRQGIPSKSQRKVYLSRLKGEDSATTVTDQQGKSRKSQTDGLGRLTTVWEDPASLDYETVYTYDALDDLATVAQGGSHNRSFVYDSLKRLTSATNPESGTVTYTYDADSNVITKKDARSITITYGYDVLNRMTGKTYSNGDPAVTYSYDQSGCLGLSTCYNVGRRTTMTDAAGSESWAYDQMGRELAEQRITNSITNKTSYTYNLDGSLATLTYPSGRIITYTTDPVERSSEAQDVANAINYAIGSCANGANSNGVCYAPQGSAAEIQNGANLFSTLYYNTRLQPCRISVKSSGTAPSSCTDASNIGNILDYTYNFNLGSANNGNVMGITNNVDTTRSQGFTYDHLNRILTAETASTFATSPAHCWGEAYVYDNATTGEFGNLTNINAASSAYTGCTQESLSVTALSNNQLSATGFSYDASGNLVADGRNNYGINAESQIKSVSGFAGVTYTYDGDGHRVEKSNGKLYWYGTGSDALMETDLSGNLTYEYIFFGGKRVARRDSSGNVVYYAADHLGTSRVVASSTGAILDQSDFYPFGGERVLSASSGNAYKFTGKERDTESGLDMFGARYYGSSLGRFMTPDWAAKPTDVPYANFGNPQSLNLYSYVENNPTTTGDPDGHCPPCAPYEVANYLDSKINSAVSYVENKAIASGNPALAATTTFAAGVTGDVGKGFTNLLRTGESVGSLPENATSGQIATAVAEEGGRVGGTILAVVAVGGSSTPATAEQGASVAGEIGQNRVMMGNGSAVDLAGKAHFEKTTGESVATPHIKDPAYNTNPNTGVTYQNGYGATRAATVGDVNAAARQAGATPPGSTGAPLPVPKKDNQ